MSEAAPRLSVVLPTYDEVDNIVPLIRRLQAALHDVEHEILVMDDRSPDGTAAAARALEVEHPALTVIEREPPAGLTRSIRDGVKRARGPLVVWMDCDLSHPPEMVRDLLGVLETGEADIAVASRYVAGGADARPLRFTRSYSRLINLMAQVVVHPGVLDYTTGYVMGPRDLILEIGLVGDYGEYCIELLGRAVLGGVRVCELPYSMADRTAGESKTARSLGGFVRRGLRYLKTLGRLVPVRLRPPHYRVQR